MKTIQALAATAVVLACSLLLVVGCKSVAQQEQRYRLLFEVVETKEGAVAALERLVDQGVAFDPSGTCMDAGCPESIVKRFGATQRLVPIVQLPQGQCPGQACPPVMASARDGSFCRSSTPGAAACTTSTILQISVVVSDASELPWHATAFAACLDGKAGCSRMPGGVQLRRSIYLRE